MEIKTLEQYILNELEKKDEELAEACAKLADVSVSYKLLKDKYDALVKALRENMSFKRSTTYVEGRGYYSLHSIWFGDDEFKLFDELFHDIREQVENDESESRETI